MSIDAQHATKARLLKRNGYDRFFGGGEAGAQLPCSWHHQRDVTRCVSA